jgi:hypothetical protein
MPGPFPGQPNISWQTPGVMAINGTIATQSNNDTPTLVNGNTIAIGALPSGQILVTNGGAVTGIILGVGLVDGQEVTIVNISANSITFAAAGTSHVADGTSDVIAALTARTYVWSALQSLWYRLG